MAQLTQTTKRLVTVEIFECDILDMVQAYADKVAGSIPVNASISYEVSADGRAALTNITVQWAEEETPEAEAF